MRIPEIADVLLDSKITKTHFSLASLEWSEKQSSAIHWLHLCLQHHASPVPIFLISFDMILFLFLLSFAIAPWESNFSWSPDFQLQLKGSLEICCLTLHEKL